MTVRQDRPRLYRAARDEDFSFSAPEDPVRRQSLENIIADCEEFSTRRPPRRIAECPNSPHPFHQLYITFYTAMQATALIEQYSFAWRVTRDRRWLRKARQWLLAASAWEHSDRVEEHFYTANRYMQAFAVALDWLGGELTEDEEGQVTDCLVTLMERWWPEVNEGRHATAGGHHAVVDNGHFGVAAAQLLGHHPMAEEWLRAVVDRFRAGIMTHGCARDGGPVDGPTFWAAENAWMLHFCDALRNVTGLDLLREFPDRVRRPLLWIRYHLAPPARLPSTRFPAANANILTGAGCNQLDEAAPVLLRLAQEARDAELRDLALTEPLLGRIHRYGVGVKGSTAECMYALGPYAYMYYDSDFRPRRRRSALPLSRKLTCGRGSQAAILRSSWGARSLIAQMVGYGGGVAHGFANLHVQWAGEPVLRKVGAAEASPVTCGSLPCVGGQNEIVATLGAVRRSDACDMVRARSPRLLQECWLLRGQAEALLVAARRRPRGISLREEDGAFCVRTTGRDCLQFPREPHFDPREGEVRMVVRLREDIDRDRPQILFNTGIGIPDTGLGTGVNNLNLGFLRGESLTFAVQSQRYKVVSATIDPPAGEFRPGVWYNIACRWGGLIDPRGEPFIEVEVDGEISRCDDVRSFGEVGADRQGLARSERRVFYTHPNTLLAFGAAVQIPNSGIACDIARIEVVCPRRAPLIVDRGRGLAGETGSGELVWKLNPAQGAQVSRHEARLFAGQRSMALRVPRSHGSWLRTEGVPYYPGGLAAGSLKRFVPGEDEDTSRILVSAGGEGLLVFLLAPRTAQARLKVRDSRLAVILKGTRHLLQAHMEGPTVLERVGD